MTARASLAGSQPLLHLSPCCLLAAAPLCLGGASSELLQLGGEEQMRGCQPLRAARGLVTGASVPDCFFLCLAYGNCLPVAF